MIATFQIPNQEVRNLIEQGEKVKAIKVWREQDHKLLNGVRVRPRLPRCMDMLRAVKSGFWDIPLCIPVDGYEVKGPHATTLTDLTFQLKRYVPEDGWRYMGL